MENSAVCYSGKVTLAKKKPIHFLSKNFEKFIVTKRAMLNCNSFIVLYSIDTTLCCYICRHF